MPHECRYTLWVSFYSYTLSECTMGGEGKGEMGGEGRGEAVHAWCKAAAGANMIGWDAKPATNSQSAFMFVLTICLKRMS